ncbi:MAG: DUF86 domain-containing protein [Pseudomonadota bacterium]
MSPIEKEIIIRKLAVIVDNLKALEPIRDMAREEYVKDVYKRKATERLLQELIEAAIDVNTHIIVQSGNTVPDDYYESFIKAGRLKIIAFELAEKLAPSAGLRNRLVHEYDLLEHSLVLDAVSMAEELYPGYIKQIKDYIEKSS